MSRVTGKLQVTIPKAVAERYGIEPGDEIELVPAGDSIRVVPAGGATEKPDVERRLALFDQATHRQRSRARRAAARPAERGWTREELYARGGADRD